MDVKAIAEEKIIRAEGTGGNFLTRTRRWWRRSVRLSPYGFASCVLGILLTLPASCNVLVIAGVTAESHTPGAVSLAETEVLPVAIWINFFLAVLSLAGLTLAVIGLRRREWRMLYPVLGIILSLLAIAIFFVSFPAMLGF